MAGIDRLRRWVLQTREDGLGPMGTNLNDLLEIADAIEEEFKEQEQAHAFAYSQVYDFANGIYGQLLNFDKMDERPEEMAEHGWVKLPVDADGVPIHIGDELKCIEALHPEVPARFKVQDMFYRGNGEWHLRAYPATYDPKKCRHHHEPTVEDLLREFVSEFNRDDTELCDEEIIERFASKLRLVDDGEE